MQALRFTFLRKGTTITNRPPLFSGRLAKSLCHAAAVDPQAVLISQETQTSLTLPAAREEAVDVGLAEEDERGKWQSQGGPMSIVPFETLIWDETLRAFPRRRGKKFYERAREEGMIPAVLTDGELPSFRRETRDVLLSLEKTDIIRLVKELGKRDFLSRTFSMKILSGPKSDKVQESVQVLPRNLNYGVGKTNILNIQLLRVPPDNMLKLGARLEYIGEDVCPGVRKGGTLKKIAKYVMYRCRPDQLPTKIIVDLSVLEIGDRVLVKHLEVDKDLLDMDEFTPVCEIAKEAKKEANSSLVLRPKGKLVKYKKRPARKRTGSETNCASKPVKK